MSRKRQREFSVSPKVQQVVWRHKKTRRGVVLAATPTTEFKPPVTPVAQGKRNANYSRDQTSPPGEGIEAAMSLPPIPAPDILAPKKGQSGKV